jgi:hypothetical protein
VRHDPVSAATTGWAWPQQEFKKGRQLIKFEFFIISSLGTVGCGFRGQGSNLKWIFCIEDPIAFRHLTCGSL